jgi:hypothetical protein
MSRPLTSSCDRPASREPDDVRIVAIPVQGEHRIDDTLYRFPLSGDSSEVSQVSLARADVVRRIRSIDALVSRDDDSRLKRGDSVEAVHPCLAGALIRLDSQHVHLVIDDVASNDCRDRRHVDDRGVLGVRTGQVQESSTEIRCEAKCAS